MAAPNFWQNIKKQEEIFVKKKSLYQYIAPNILAMVGMSCYILADTFFIATSQGTNGITAVSYTHLSVFFSCRFVSFALF